MNFKEIKRLISLVEASNISHFSIEEDGVKMEVKKEFSMGAQQTSVVLPQQIPVAVPELSQGDDSNKSDDDDLVPIKSQMVGTFYDAPKPDLPAFVKVGDFLSKGDVICIVEAMKLFNEIESEIEGTVEKVCVKSGDPVEYGQTLMLIRP